MAYIIFYEKPGCINNTKQKKWLEAAGHAVEAVNLLEHDWTFEVLKKFFGDKSIIECFNLTAPVIKSGELNPSDFTEKAALEQMIKDPILIKRPLMNIDDMHYLQGFDKEKIHELIGLSAISGKEEVVHELENTDLTTCPQLAKNTSCDEIKPMENSRPLGALTEVVEQMGLEVTYAYDDLVFVAHTAFMFQFPETEGVNLYFNKDCPEKDAGELFLNIVAIAEKKKLNIVRKGIFTMHQKEGEENIEIEFLDQ